MPNFDIVKGSDPSDSFRVESIKGQYDLQAEKIVERFTGNIDIEDKEWEIGVIYGASGTGKTTIAREIFGEDYIIDFDYKQSSVIDDFPEGASATDITKVLNSVGFSSPPSWLKPYAVLSTGEQMRVNLARAILSEKELIVFDEFTSTVDRVVARIGSSAIQKAVRKSGKKFIAVSCHSDILEWLEPDWIFCTDDMKFQYARGSLRRPDIEIKIYKEKGKWNLFRKYHYLSHELNEAADQYVGYIDNNPVCFLAILHQPHRKTKMMKRISRIVVLPDYQGISLGIDLFNFVANLYKEKGYRVVTTFSHFVLTKALRKNKMWAVTSCGRKMPHTNLNKGGKFSSVRRITMSFEYIGDKNGKKH